MARILDNILPATAARAVKLRQSYDWTKTEHDAIPGKYEEKKQEKLNKFIYKANNSFARQPFWPVISPNMPTEPWVRSSGNMT